MAEIKEIKYGHLSINATHWAAKGKDAFKAHCLKKFADRPLFAKRDTAAREKWVDEMWKLIELETGIKTPEKPVKENKNTGAGGAA